MKKYLKALSLLYDEHEARALIRRVIAHYSQLEPAKILAYPDLKLEPAVETAVRNALDELCTSRPLQYVLGRTEFFRREFFVNSDVLIPRPETEELVQAVICHSRGKSISILDLGKGSGCIAVSLACELPQAEVFAIDLSEPALHIARRNAEHNSATVRFARHDILSRDELPFGCSFDLIVSNPPYVRMSEKTVMHNNVLLHEPHLALFVPDESPLIYYQAIVRIASRYLNPRGAICAEINENLGKETRRLFADAGFNAEIRKDIRGKDRILFYPAAI